MRVDRLQSSCGAAMLAALAILAASPVVAQTRVQAEEICRTAVTQRYGNGYKFERTDAAKAGSGNWSVSGQGQADNGERVEFACTLQGRQATQVSLARAADEGSRREATCASKDFKRSTCRMDTRGGVALVGQISKTPCKQGSNWGYDSGSVWVDDGCSGRFASGRR